MFQNIVTKYELNPETVDCIIFCSKNYEPILPYITSITNKFNTYFHYTITAYDKDIEPNVPSIDKSIETLIKLSKIVGKQRIAWRYDPVLLTNNYTKEHHYKTFDYMAQKISPYIDRCIFSFVEMYKKLKTNMPEIILLTEQDKIELAKNIGEISKKYNLITQTCATNGDYSKFNILPSGCMTLEILGNANNIHFKKLKHKGMRENCGCFESRNIGDYDTCPNGCKYCYANQNRQIALENFKKHNPNSPLILGNLKESDIIQKSNQKSFLIKDVLQQKLF
jgi:DNA repair photolyase